MNEIKIYGPKLSRKRLAFCVLLLLLCYGAIESLFYIGIRFLPSKDRRLIAVSSLSERHVAILKSTLVEESTSYLVLDRALGWTIRPNATSEDGLHRSNSQGLRGSRDYTFQRTGRTTLRLLAFGDSFTHGSNVSNPDTWAEQITRLHPSVEVVNFGVDGYGLDQAYLRFQTTKNTIKGDVVLIGFMSENIQRVLNVYRPFYFTETGVPFSKPRFILNNGSLHLIENPLPDVDAYKELLSNPSKVLPEIGRNDFFFRRLAHQSSADYSPFIHAMKIGFNLSVAKRDFPVQRSGSYRADSQGLAITKAIFDAFYKEVQEYGALPVVLLFPNERDHQYYLQNGKVTYEPLVTFLEQRRYNYVDLLKGLKNSSYSRRPGGHYDTSQNAVVASSILNWLQGKGILRER